MSEKELTVQVAKIDRIQIDNVNFAEAGENEVLEELTPNTPSTNHQNAGLSLESAGEARKRQP